MDISIIAPQHGSVIKNHIDKYIKALRELECGSFIRPIKKDLAKAGGYREVCSAVLKRYTYIFKKHEVLEALDGLEIVLDRDTMEIIDYNYSGIVLWDGIFEQILAKKGMRWLTVIEPFVHKLSKEYDIPIPGVFEATLRKAEEAVDHLSEENAMLKELNEELNNSIIPRKSL